MQLDPVRKSMYEKKAPELLDAVTSGESALIMKRDPKTDYCVKFDNGLCGIHKKYGSDMLGDACHFYPRITRKYGDLVQMTASLSCPEIARLALFGENPFAMQKVKVDRVPYSTKNYITDEMQNAGIDSLKAEQIIQEFMKLAGDTATSPERIMARIISLGHSLSNLPFASWVEALPFMIRTVDGRLPEPEPDPHDNLYLLQSLAALIHASRKTDRERLLQTISVIESSLGYKIDWETLNLVQSGNTKLPELNKYWATNRDFMDNLLKKWVKTQLMESGFPFSGFGATLKEKVMILGVRFATVKLAWLASLGESGSTPNNELLVRSAQSLARFMDHLENPTLSIQLYANFGWNREPRLRSLIGR